MEFSQRRGFLFASAVLSFACATSPAAERPGGGGGSGGTGIIGAGGLGVGGTGVIGQGGGTLNPDGGDQINPTTCDQAGSARTYVGCEFWPTVTANPVWVEFDPALVVANGSPTEAVVTVDGPAGFHQMVTVPPGGLETILLKWVMDLKGPEFSITNTSGGRLTASTRVDKGSYHMTSSVPVTAWQFNPLQYKKSGSSCARFNVADCLSATVDASLLLPTTAMTGNYRVFAYSSKNEGMDWGSVPGGIAITATQDNTMVKVGLAKKCGVEIYPTTDLGTCVAAGTGVDAKNGGDVYTFQMNASDVVELVGEWAKDPQTHNADLSGSIVNASAPVQVVTFNAIAQLPDVSIANADHMEETVLPGEVIGKKYIVAPPTTPNGNAVGHVVRIYGNVDNTHLTYPEGTPPGAPTVINAGDVVQIPPLPQGQPAPQCLGAADHCMLSQPFIVEGDQPFAVASFMVGGVLQMPGTGFDNSQGDPAMSMMVTPEQFRKDYTFLAPADFLENFADVLVPQGAAVTLDGKPLPGTPERIGNSEWGIVRAKLDGAGGGVHKLSTTDDRGVGLQVAGFGFATSYYYPGGLNLRLISEPPVIDIAK
jgi:IgGFc binding protein